MATNKHTRPSITDPILRSIMANELLVLRKLARNNRSFTMSPSEMSLVVIGLETALRRVQFQLDKTGDTLNACAAA